MYFLSIFSLLKRTSNIYIYIYILIAMIFFFIGNLLLYSELTKESTSWEQARAIGLRHPLAKPHNPQLGQHAGLISGQGHFLAFLHRTPPLL